MALAAPLFGIGCTFGVGERGEKRGASANVRAACALRTTLLFGMNGVPSKLYFKSSSFSLAFNFANGYSLRCF
ncbi:MAG: hypothetical protein RR268_06865 [Kiritimatiellia bacterium]